MYPLAVAYSVTVAGDIDHVPLSVWRRNVVVRLLVSDEHKSVVALAASLFDLIERLAQISRAVRLRRVEGIAQSHPTTRRNKSGIVREGKDCHLLCDLAKQNRQAIRGVSATYLGAMRERNFHRARD